MDRKETAGPVHGMAVSSLSCSRLRPSGEGGGGGASGPAHRRVCLLPCGAPEQVCRRRL